MARVYPRALFYPLLITKTSAERMKDKDDSNINNSDSGGLSMLTALTFDSSAEAFAEVGGGGLLRFVIVL